MPKTETSLTELLQRMTNPRDLARHVRREMTDHRGAGGARPAIHFAQQGLRAARLLGLYGEEGREEG